MQNDHERRLVSTQSLLYSLSYVGGPGQFQIKSRQSTTVAGHERSGYEELL